jgi:hypothetical protein
MKSIAVYNEFRAQLADLKSHNSAVVFDYESPAGNKEARSHIYKLRQTKSAVDKARAAEKAASLEYGRRVDSEAKAIISEIEEMIAVHQRPLEEIEQRETARKAAHERRLAEMGELAAVGNEDISAADLRARLETLESYAIGPHWEEFEVGAARTKDAARAALVDAIEKREKYEAEQAELARLRREQAEREQAERDARIAAEAAEREKKAAEQRAIAEREAAERREQDLLLERERAERAKADAELRAERAEQAAKENAEREAKERAEREAEDARRRESNKRHAAAVMTSAIKALVAGGMDDAQAKLAVELIAQKRIPAVSIAF